MGFEIMGSCDDDVVLTPRHSAPDNSNSKLKIVSWIYLIR